MLRVHSLDRDTHEPMYEQIARTIKNDVIENAYRDFGFIGTQKEIAARFDVSLITVKKAVELLTKENIVYSKQGKGVFVKRHAVGDRLEKLTGITNIMKSMNIYPQIKVKNIRQVETPYHFDEGVRKMLGDKCLLVERFHINDNQVLAYAKLYLPLEHGNKFSREDYENNTVYQLYQNKLGVALGKGIQNIRACPAGHEHAEAMKINRGTPLLFIERYSYDSKGGLIEVMELFYEHSQYFFRVEMNLSAD